MAQLLKISVCSVQCTIKILYNFRFKVIILQQHTDVSKRHIADKICHRKDTSPPLTSVAALFSRLLEVYAAPCLHLLPVDGFINAGSINQHQ